MSLSCRSVRSPEPGVRGLIASVDEASFANFRGRLPPEGTTFGSILWKSTFSPDYRKKWKDFVYNGQGEDTRNGGTLLFSPPKTVAEANTPFRITTDFKDFYWDPILLALVFIRDPFGRTSSYINPTGTVGTATAPRYRVREIYIPGGKIGTEFITKEYLSPIPFTLPNYETPIPRSVTYDIPGAQGGFPSCIGPKIVIPNLEAGMITSVSGTPGAVGGSLKGQIFPETNVIDWERRVIFAEQKLVPGGYHLVTVGVEPPEQPEIVIS